MHGTFPPPPKRSSFPIGPAAKAFKKRFFPEASTAEWNDWRWQARARIRDLAGLERIFTLSPDERDAVGRRSGALPVGITPYYAHLLDRDDATQGLRRTHIPTGEEFVKSPGEYDDPLGEDAHMPAPNLVHRYPDRALFLVTGFCSTYCRYCTRARMVGEVGGEWRFAVEDWQRAVDYIARTPVIRDILISGGDPLTIADDKLGWLLERLRAIRHVEFIRIGTKVPLVLPQRITKDFARLLGKHRVWLSLHCTHPDELTPETTEAFDRLADRGVPLGSQTVLLKGVNDDVETMKRLMHGLLMRRVKPYYLFQCDPITGSAHFRTPVDKGIEIIRALRGHTTGYAVPHYAIDAPNGGGKIALVPDYLEGREGDDILIRNFEGKLFRYADPGGSIGGRG